MNQPPDEGLDSFTQQLPQRRPRREAPYPPPPRQPRPVKGDGGARYNLKIVAVAAFIFGVALHGCVALSVLQSDSSAEPENSGAPIVIETPQRTGAEVTPTPTTLPDRTSCDEIRGTEYRSAAERDFFRANCITTTGLLPGGGSFGASVAPG